MYLVLYLATDDDIFHFYINATSTSLLEWFGNCNPISSRDNQQNQLLVQLTSYGIYFLESSHGLLLRWIGIVMIMN